MGWMVHYFGRVLRTRHLHWLIDFACIHFALCTGVLSAAAAVLYFPAGQGNIEDCRAAFTFFFRAVANGPAGCHGQELFNSGNIEAIIAQLLSEALEPLKFVV